ncbi:MAG TPA: hypothetical protein VGG03_07630 [Thermoanaerobaculia bacterium]|jgi:hypothetical protein
MKVTIVTAIDGKVELPAEFAVEGAHVVVLAPESEGAVLLPPADERELLEAMDEIRRGEYEDGDDLLNELWPLDQS